MARQEPARNEGNQDDHVRGLQRDEAGSDAPAVRGARYQEPIRGIRQIEAGSAA